MREVMPTTRVVVTEHDRWSGPKVLDEKEFNTKEDAEIFCQQHNANNTQKRVPDYYTTAEIIE